MDLKQAFNKGIMSGRYRYNGMDHRQKNMPKSLNMQFIADRDIRQAVTFAKALGNVKDNRGYPLAVKSELLYPNKDVTITAQSGPPGSITIRKNVNDGLSIIFKRANNTISRKVPDIDTALEDAAYWVGESLPNYENYTRPIIEKF